MNRQIYRHTHTNSRFYMKFYLYNSFPEIKLNPDFRNEESYIKLILNYQIF